MKNLATVLGLRSALRGLCLALGGLLACGTPALSQTTVLRTPNSLIIRGNPDVSAAWLCRRRVCWIQISIPNGQARKLCKECVMGSVITIDTNGLFRPTGPGTTCGRD
jgi:hypothetical protein